MEYSVRSEVRIGGVEVVVRGKSNWRFALLGKNDERRQGFHARKEVSKLDKRGQVLIQRSRDDNSEGLEWRAETK